MALHSSIAPSVSGKLLLSASLYSHESCEEDIVHTSMLDSTNEMDNTKVIVQDCKSLFAIALRHIFMKNLSQTSLKYYLQEMMFHINY